jgi:hypothetical protein
MDQLQERGRESLTSSDQTCQKNSQLKKILAHTAPKTQQPTVGLSFEFSFGFKKSDEKMTDWNETKSILFEIEQIFLRDDDLKDINDINKMMVEIENERNGHLADFRELLRRMLFPFVAHCIHAI